jgi:hypothetical protein
MSIFVPNIGIQIRSQTPVQIQGLVTTGSGPGLATKLRNHKAQQNIKTWVFILMNHSSLGLYEVHGLNQLRKGLNSEIFKTSNTIDNAERKLFMLSLILNK